MKSAATILAVAAWYVALAQMVALFYVDSQLVSIFWPPSGLALAAVLIGGRRYGIAVYAGIFTEVLMNGLPIPAALLIAAGGTVAALTASRLLTCRGADATELATLNDYLRLLLFGAGVGSLIAATCGAGALLLFTASPKADFAAHVLRWWMGDALGVVLVTPLLLVWRKPPADWLTWRKGLPALASLGVTFAAGQIVFLNWLHSYLGLIAHGFQLFLFVSLTAIYAGLHGTVIAVALIVCQALLGAHFGIGYFAHDLAKSGLASFWFYALSLTVVGMIQASYITERKRIEAALNKEKQRYQLVLKTASDGIHIVDPQGRLLEASDSFYAMLGYPAGTAMSVKDWNTEYTEEQLQHIFRQIIAEPVHFQTRHRKADGQLIDIELNARSLKVNGQYFLIASARDISASKRFEAQLRESESRFRHIANAAPTLIWMSDTDKRCYWFNKVWLDFTGRSLQQEIGNGWAEGVHPDDLSHCLQTYAGHFAARQPFRMEYRLKRHDDEFRWLLDIGVPLYDDTGVFMGYIGSCIDITDSKRAQDDLQQFAEIAAHHLQEPTRRLLSFAQQLHKHYPDAGDDNDDVKLMLVYLEQGALRLRALLTDIQLYLAAAAPRGPIEAIDVAEVVQTVVQLHVQPIRQRAATIRCPAMPPVDMDRARLTDIVNILLDNALRHTGSDRALVIDISGVAKADRVYCRFADNGPGIPEPYRERVFRVFERLQTSDDASSTGIGLAIVKRIVESCRGSVSLGETDGGGVTVLFDLPRYDNDDA